MQLLLRHPLFSTYLEMCLNLYAEHGLLSPTTSKLCTLGHWEWYRSSNCGEADRASLPCVSEGFKR